VTPVRAWEAVAAAGGPAAEASGVVAAMLVAGGSATEGLRVAARSTDRLDMLALTWDVVERSGAPVAAVLERAAAAIRAEEDAEAARRVALAGPRATASVLAGLPVVGLGLAWLLGANPVATLLGTELGRACLLCGCLFWWTGRAWTAQLVNRARTQP
jgi:tight adherence protein B